MQGSVVTTTHNQLTYHVIGVDHSLTLDSPMGAQQVKSLTRKSKHKAAKGQDGQAGQVAADGVAACGQPHPSTNAS